MLFEPIEEIKVNTVKLINVETGDQEDTHVFEFRLNHQGKKISLYASSGDAWSRWVSVMNGFKQTVPSVPQVDTYSKETLPHAIAHESFRNIESK